LAQQTFVCWEKTLLRRVIGYLRWVLRRGMNLWMCANEAVYLD
jgi:hypothetical protein